MNRIPYLITTLILLSYYAYSQSGSHYSLDFDGSTTDVTVKDHADLNPAKELCVEAWIHPESFGKDYFVNSIFCKHGWSSGNAGYVLRVGASGVASFIIATTGSKWAEARSSTGIVPLKTWTHIAGTFDGDTVAIYVNGVLVASSLYKGAIRPSTGLDAKVGELAYGTGRNFDGKIDEIRVWDKAIDQDTIRTWMCRKFRPSHPNRERLMGYYRMDSTKGKVMRDYSGNGNNGALNGPKWLISGAPIGDTSVYTYGASTTSLSIKGDSADVFTVQNMKGKRQSVHLYMNQGKPMADSVTFNQVTLDSTSSWGVFYAKPSSNTHDIVYDYGAMKSVKNVKESYLDIFEAENQASEVWSTTNSELYALKNKIKVTGSKQESYSIGRYEKDRKLFTASGDSAFCLGDPMIVIAPGNSSFSYQWYKDGKILTGDTSQFLITTVDGKFHAEISRGTIKTTSIVKKITGVAKTKTTLATIPDVCEDINSLYIKGGLPSGGIYYGSGVDKDGWLNPEKMGPGTYDIIYQFTNSTGCTARDTKQLYIRPLPKVKLNKKLETCDNEDTLRLNAGTPAGGVYTGAGVSNGFFYTDSVSKKPGSYKYIYTVTTSYGCASADTSKIDVWASTKIEFKTMDTMCENQGRVKIKVNPNQGVYSGTGVKDKYFHPIVAGKGTHQVSFEFTNFKGCVTKKSTDLVVESVSQASIQAKEETCVNDDSLLLTKGLPSGGVYLDSIDQKITHFVPSLFPRSRNKIKYVYTSTNGCTDTAVGLIQVFDTVPVEFKQFPILCFHEEEFDMTTLVNPGNGVFSGSGVDRSKSTLDPSIAGEGKHTILYAYTAPTGCVSRVTSEVEVSEESVISFEINTKFCQSADSVRLTTKPKGGQHFGDGVRDNYFVPSKANAGKQWIRYQFTNSTPSGCTWLDSVEIEILPSPMVQLARIRNFCTHEEEFTLAGGIPAGGTYFIDEIETTTVDLSQAGTYDLSYEYENADGCSGSASQPVIVNQSPDKPIITLDGNELSSSSTSDNQWFHETEGKIEGDSNQVFEPSKDGKYYVEVTANGCTQQSELIDFTRSSIHDGFSSRWSVYPNPSQSDLYIQAKSDIQSATISIYSIEGKLLKTQQMNSSLEVMTLDNYPSGIYMMTIRTEDGRLYQEKIQIQTP